MNEAELLAEADKLAKDAIRETDNIEEGIMSLALTCAIYHEFIRKQGSENDLETYFQRRHGELEKFVIQSNTDNVDT